MVEHLLAKERVESSNLFIRLQPLVSEVSGLVLLIIIFFALVNLFLASLFLGRNRVATRALIAVVPHDVFVGLTP